MEITALEEQLLADSDGSQAALLKEQLQQLQWRLRQRLRTPQRPDEHTALQQQLQATETAEQVITILAQRYHNHLTNERGQ